MGGCACLNCGRPSEGCCGSDCLMEIGWRPGIGDPTVWGWVTVAAYFAASLLSMRAARCSQISGRRWQREGVFWACVGALTLAFGINKQLDLQSLLTDIARSMAKNGHWYESRRGLQETAIGLFAALGLTVMLTIVLSLRNSLAEVKGAATGLCVVTTFVMIRAASFHHVDALLSKAVIGMNWNVLLELPGIIMIAVAALFYSRRIDPRRRARRLCGDSNDR